MLSKVVEIMFVAAVIIGLACGKIPEVSSKSSTAAGEAVATIISMAGSICFWSGIMEIMSESGLSKKLTRILKAPITFIYGKLSGDREAVSLLSQNMAANILGLGSAATPAGLRAADRLKSLNEKGSISNVPILLLVVVNTVSIQLIPATVAAARGALGAASPYDILIPVWLASICSLAAALFFARIFIGGESS